MEPAPKDARTKQGLAMQRIHENAFRIAYLLSSLIWCGFAASNSSKTVRLTGTVQAVHSLEVRVPLVEGQSGEVTVTRLVKNGVAVRPGDVIAEFDDTSQVRLARDAASKYDDLLHQVEQKRAEHVTNAEK